MQTLWQDARYGMRRYGKKIGLTSAAVLMLALGIGANTTIFSMINAALFRSLPVAAPEELTNIYTSNPDGTGYSTSSYPDFEDLRQLDEIFSGVIAYAGINVAITGDGRSELIFGEMVSGNYFQVLGVKPLLGRAFLTEEEMTPGAHAVAILSHRLWQRRFGADAEIIGKQLVLNGRNFTIVGVAPADFKGLMAPGLAMEVWVPVTMVGALRQGEEALRQRGQRWLSLKGRLRSGVRLEQAQAAVSTVARRLELAHPESNERRALSLLPTASVQIHPTADGRLYVIAGLLMVVVFLVLLVACSNLVNLLLVDISSRRREIAVRTALGASRFRLVRQFMTESLLLGLLGGTAGLLLAIWLTDLLAGFRPPLPVPLSLDLSVDARVLGFTLLLSVITGVLFGSMAALKASKTDVMRSLKDEVSRLPLGRRVSFRDLLTVAQIALSLVLLIAAGLFVRSLQKAQSIDPGFDADHAAIISFNLGLQGYNEERGRDFYRRMLERARALPGAQSAGLTDRLPLSNLGPQTETVFIEGRSYGPDDTGTAIQYARISNDYLSALDIPLIRGRNFSERETAVGPRVAVINQVAAELFWPDDDPLGKRLRMSDGEVVEVVGISGSTTVATLNEAPQPYLYLSFEQDYSSLMQVVVRASGNPADLIEPLRNLAREQDDAVAIFQLKTMPEHIGIELFPLRMTGGLLALFGLLALLMASIGLYGLISYSVSQRTRELGIRLALGAQRRDIFRLVIGQGLVMTVIGVGIGIVASLGLTRFLSSLLFAVSATDSLTFLGVSLLLTFVALLACYIPARRATRVDPMVALRYE